MSRRLAVPAGQGDDGCADAALEAALSLGDAGAVATALATARVFVAVEPQLLEVDPDSGADKISEMALVTLRHDNGASAVPAFSSVASLAAWRPQARPVPVAASALFAEARRMGHTRVVVDIAGPGPVVLDVAAPGNPEAGGGLELALPQRPLERAVRRRVGAVLRAPGPGVRVEAWHADLVTTGSGAGGGAGGRVRRPVIAVSVSAAGEPAAGEPAAGENGENTAGGSTAADEVVRRLWAAVGAAAKSGAGAPNTRGSPSAPGVIVVPAAAADALRRRLPRVRPARRWGVARVRPGK